MRDTLKALLVLKALITNEIILHERLVKNY